MQEEYRKFVNQYIEKNPQSITTTYVPNSDFFSKHPKKSLRLLSNTFDAHCPSKIQLDTSSTDIYADLDISSCYSNAIAQTPDFIGEPICSDEEILLNKFVLKVLPSLYPSGWVSMIETKEPLAYDQDLLVNLLQDEDSYESAVWTDPSKSNIRLNSKNLKNSILTHHDLQVILTYFSKKRKADFLNKIIVKSWSGYAKSNIVDEKMFNIKLEKHLKNNVDTYFQEHHFFKGFKLCCHQKFGERLYHSLLDYRSESQQDKKCELPINALFRAITSPEFKSGNKITLNNITSRVRVQIWCYEKTLNASHATTDGISFNINKVRTHLDL